MRHRRNSGRIRSSSSVAYCLCLTALVLAACGRDRGAGGEAAAPSAGPRPAAAVDGARIVAADREPGNWLTHGRTYSEQRFSPLEQINPDTSRSSGSRGITISTPTAARRRRPSSSTASCTSARRGARSRRSMRQAANCSGTTTRRCPDAKASNACCDVVNRGVAVWKGRSSSARSTDDSFALDAATGKPVWTVQTTDPDQALHDHRRAAGDQGQGAHRQRRRRIRRARLRHAPTMQAGRPGLALLHGARATRPLGFESDSIAEAAPTWTGEWWTLGGGGTVWDAIVYDPELEPRLYRRRQRLAVEPGDAQSRRRRQPVPVSIVALDADTGEYAWHYQTTPGETWDYTATQPMMLADLEIGGETRKVIMQAPKNGFFYVLDRDDRRADLGREVRRRHLGERDRPGDRPADRESPRRAMRGTATRHGHCPGPAARTAGTRCRSIPRPVSSTSRRQDAGFPYFADPDFKSTTLGFNVGVDFDSASMPADSRSQKGGVRWLKLLPARLGPGETESQHGESSFPARRTGAR